MPKSSEIASRMSRAAREAAATLLGQRGFVRTLKGEHAALRTLMARCERCHSTGRGLALRRQLFHELRAELLAHAEAEQQEVYSVLGQHELTRGRVEENRRQHHGIEVLLQDLSLLRPDDPLWLERFELLVRDVERHFEEEETLLFPLAERTLTPERVREVDRRFRVAKRRALRAVAVELH